MDTTQTEKETKLMAINAELVNALEIMLEQYADCNDFEQDSPIDIARSAITAAKEFNHAL